MKNLAAAAILAFAASGSGALAQVYGGEDDPYQQSPFASNSYVPPPEPAATQAPAPTPAPTSTAAVTPQQDTAAPPQKATAGGDPAKKQP